jgi:hypothetical protein
MQGGIGVMRRIAVCISIVGAASLASAQTTLDDFEPYADDAAIQVEWTGSAQATLGLSGGANGTTKWMKLTDADSYQGNLANIDITTPTAGNYKVTFFYKNGQGGNAAEGPCQDLKLFVKQGGSNLASFTMPDTVQDTWTAAETPIFAATATAIEVFISKNNPSGPVAPATLDTAAFDEIKLVPVAVVPLSVAVSPSAAIYIGNTQTITATPAGGSGVYTQVQFDVGNDGSFEGTDASAPYTFDFNTRTVVAAQGTATVAVKVTDSLAATQSTVVTYNVDNRWGGRVPMVSNGDFSSFTGSSPNNLPTNWIEFQQDGNKAYGPDAASYSPAAGQCLKISFLNSSDYTNRYTVRSTGYQGIWLDLQAWYWGKGSSNRIYFCLSTDGLTYASQTAAPAAAVNNASWTFVEGTLKNYPMLATDYVCLATHNFALGDSWYDDVKMMGILDISATVGDWKLY